MISNFNKMPPSRRSSAKIRVCLGYLFFGVHDERVAHHERLVQRLTSANEGANGGFLKRPALSGELLGLGDGYFDGRGAVFGPRAKPSARIKVMSVMPRNPRKPRR